MKALSLLLLAMVAFRPTATPGSPPAVQYADGRLTADLQDADAVDVLGQVALQAGLQVRGRPTPQRISIQLDAVPLPDAVPRLFQGQSFALTYDRSGALKGIRFLGATEATGRVTAAAPSPPTAGEPVAPPLEVGESDPLADIQRTVPVGGRLAEALGSERVPFSYVVGIAMQSGDARLRRDALRVGLQLINSEPELRADVLRMLDGFDDPSLAGRLTEAAGDNAAQVARRTARTARSKPLRARAAAVEQLLLRTVDPGRRGG